jgi:predicted patatin/cPLA2 family phospholipase
MVDGKPMLDGGIVDSIPVERAISQGYERNVVILTRNKGYRKTGHDRKIPHFFYRDYPRLRVMLSHRLESYNRQLELVEQLEREGKIVCIRPERPLEVDRIEKDVQKLERLYEEGFQMGERFLAL